MKKTYVVAGEENEWDLEQDLRINNADLNGEFIKFSLLFAKWGTAFEMALDYENRLKTELEKMYAYLGLQIREEAKVTGNKITENMVESMILTHPDYMALQNKWLDARSQLGVLKAARDSVFSKKDMLISLGSNYRMENKTDFFVKNQQEAVSNVLRAHKEKDSKEK